MSMAVQPLRHFTPVDRSASQSITNEFGILYYQAAMTCNMFISGTLRKSHGSEDPKKAMGKYNVNMEACVTVKRKKLAKLCQVLKQGKTSSQNRSKGWGNDARRK